MKTAAGSSLNCGRDKGAAGALNDPPAQRRQGRGHTGVRAVPAVSKGAVTATGHVPNSGKDVGIFPSLVTFPSHSDAVFHHDSAQVAQRLHFSVNLAFSVHLTPASELSAVLTRETTMLYGITTSIPFSSITFRQGTSHHSPFQTSGAALDIPARTHPQGHHGQRPPCRGPAAHSLICPPSPAAQVGNGAALRWQIPRKGLSESVALTSSGAFPS